ncbi:phage tail protein [Aeromonas caviae]|uniref:phage tail protein n=1 Tax=Aeromonas caviae TaxID=648 RepID=UPI002B4A87B1|nr:tail fiber protein [Aeromonas caviae]
MANLQEVVSWDAGVYQLETSDPVLGGPGGTSNKQAQALANRTAYLKKHMDDLEGGTTAAGKANKLTTARTIAVAGDVTGQASFDGSGNISITATYKNSGVVAGTYRSVTVDAKGNVTAGSNPTTLSGYGITDALPATGTAAAAQKLATARTIALAGDVTGQANFDGSGNISITATYKNSGVAAGTYRSVTVDAKGNITAGSNPTTLSGYGITDAVSSTQYATEATKGIAATATQAEVDAGTDDSKFVMAKKLMAALTKDIAANGYPAGAPIPWPLETPPDGYLMMTGQSFSAATYPKLALAYPALVLPDMRAEFIRGWDAGRGVDVGRGVNTWQVDDNRAHNHQMKGLPNNGGGVVAGVYQATRVYSHSGAGGTAEYLSVHYPEASGGSEARPRNRSFNYIVRAA